MTKTDASWWAEGLLFENCNCSAVCPGHVHFSQKCTNEVCHGYWALRFRAGQCAGVELAGVDAVILYECPQVMISGDWKQMVIVSDQADPEQRLAVEQIISGKLGGPWEVLARFVGESLPSKAMPISISERNGSRSVEVRGLLRSTIAAIRGRDRTKPVTFTNIYNQIHSPNQVIARGSTQCEGEFVIHTEETHGLWSEFRWQGGDGERSGQKAGTKDKANVERAS